MTGLKRVVFDTSTLIGAALRIGSIPDSALSLGFRSWEVWASTETLAELEEVLGRKKFDQYLSGDSRRDFVALMRRRAQVASPVLSDLFGIDRTCRDSKDNKFLALALQIDASALVSSDQDLLVLHPWRGIRIVTPGEFVAEG